jgi:hypothetical protein
MARLARGDPVRAARVALAATGVILTGVGIYFLVTTEPPKAVLGVVVWLAAAVVIHDGVIAPGTTAANALLSRVGRRLPHSALLVIRTGFGLGVVLTLVVVPELIAQARPHANPTILVGDYLGRLIVVWGVIVLAVAIATIALTWRTRRTIDQRPSIHG